MSLAERTREAVRERPFLLDGLRVGVVNYTAAARHVDVDGDVDAIATALRRFAEELPAYRTDARSVRVTMESGLGRTEDAADALLVLGDAAFAPTGGSLTGVLATGDVDARALSAVIRRLDATEVDVEAAAVAGDALLIAVKRRASADAVRTVEDALGGVPNRSY